MRALACVALLLWIGACGKHPAGDAVDAARDSAGSAGDAPRTGDAAVTSACVEVGQVDPYAPVAGPLAVPQDKGKLLACAHTETVSAAMLSANPVISGLGLTAAAGYDHYVVQYVSEGPVGTPRRVTASVYVPDGGAQHVTLVAVNHGTSGMGQPCGPTHFAAAAAALDEMVLPMVAHGFAVVATDYQGMGVAGEPLSPYTFGHAEALAILDGVRAMWRFHSSAFDAAQLDHRFFLLGHSQGGQATLFAHEDVDASVGGDLLGSVAFAPAIGDERGYKYLLGQSLAPTQLPAVPLVMLLHGHAIYSGTPMSSLLTAQAQQMIPALLANDCITDLETALPAAAPTIGQLFAPGFVSGAAACNLDGTPCPAFEPWNTELLADEPGSFQSAAPTLILQGGADTTVPANFTACIQDRITNHNPGANDLACLYAGATHPTIVTQAMVDALGWMDSVASGSPPAFCPQFVPLPANCPPL